MSAKQLTKEVMALPLAERAAMAQALWQSIDCRPGGAAAAAPTSAVEEAGNRDKELSSGQVIGRTHQQVMRAARKALECG